VGVAAPLFGDRFTVVPVVHAYAVRTAASSGRTLLLERGTHFTTPLPEAHDHGRPARLEIAHAKAATKTVIKRPDFSIPASSPEDNFGLFFVPAEPGDPELAQAVWKPAMDAHGHPFEFEVFTGAQQEVRNCRRWTGNYRGTIDQKRLFHKRTGEQRNLHFSRR
jgi:hypothetical protein